MSAADAQTRSVWCCLCCARPADESLDESQRLLRDGQDQAVRKQPGKSYGASDTHVQTPTDPAVDKPQVQGDSQEIHDNTTVDVVPKRADPEPESSETSSNKPQHRPDVVPTEETEPGKTEDTDASVGAAHTESPDLPAETVPQEKPHAAEKSDDKETPPAAPAEHGDTSQGANLVSAEPERETTHTETPADAPQDTGLSDKTEATEEAPTATTEADDESISILQPVPGPEKSIESEQSHGDSLTAFSMLADQGEAVSKVAPETDPVDITASEKEKVQTAAVLEEAPKSEKEHDATETEVTTDTHSPTSTPAAEGEAKHEEKTDDTMAAGEYKPPESHEKVEDEVAAIADKTEDNPNPEVTTEDKETDSAKPGDPTAKSGQSAGDRAETLTTLNKPDDSVDEHGS